MKPSNRMNLVATVLILATLACNIPQSQAPAQDPNAAITAAVQTVSAQLTQSAGQNQVQIQPSATAIPSATSTSTQIPAVTIQPPATIFVPSATSQTCDVALFVADVSIPDNTVMTPGEDFTKTWRLKNTGTCTWSTSYDAVFSSGSQMGAVSEQALTGSVAPGQTIDISVNMTAPSTNGTYTGYWKLRNASGIGFSSFYVQIKVGSGGSSGGSFAVTSVTYTVSGACGGFHIVAYVTVNGPGTVTFHWVFNGNDPVESTYGTTLAFGAAGTKATHALDWYITASGTHFAQVYIDSPNNQYIGKAFVTCP